MNLGQWKNLQYIKEARGECLNKTCHGLEMYGIMDYFYGEKKLIISLLKKIMLMIKI